MFDCGSQQDDGSHNHFIMGTRPRVSELISLGTRLVGITLLGASWPLLAENNPPRGAVAEEVIVLRPFPSPTTDFFEQTDAKSHRPWRCGKLGNIELLSCCSDDSGQDVLREIQRRLDSIRKIIPPSPIAAIDKPILVLLYRDSTQWAANHDPQSIPLMTGTHEDFTAVVNLNRYEDITDLAARQASLVRATGEIARRFVMDQLDRYLARSLDGRSAWARLGVHRLYASIAFDSDGAAVSPTRTRSAAPSNLEWLPLTDLFDVPYDEQRETWQTEIDRFTRWSLLADRGAHAGAFWTFCQRVTAEKPTEKLLHECFGQNYAELRSMITQSQVSEHGGNLGRKRGRWPNAIPLTNATAAEIARFRTSVDAVVAHQPNL